MNVNAVGVVKIPIIDLIATGKNIKRIREASGISVRDIQDVLGVTIDEILVKDEDDDPGDGEVILKSSDINVINAQW